MNASSFNIEIDQSLIEAIQQGDLFACEQVYKLFEKPVYNLAFRISQCADDAQDVLQETFIKVFKRSHQFRGEAPYWSWIRQITINTTMQLLRSKQRHLKRTVYMENLEPVLSLVTDNNDPSNSIECNQVERILSSLSLDARTVVWLYDVEGLTHREIASVMRKTISFSKTQLSRAHEKLRKHLSSRYEAPERCKKIVAMN